MCDDAWLMLYTMEAVPFKAASTRRSDRTASTNSRRA